MSHMRFDLRFGAGSKEAAPHQTGMKSKGFPADADWDLLLTKKLPSVRKRPYFMVIDGLNPMWAFQRKKAVRKRRCPWPKLVTF